GDIDAVSAQLWCGATGSAVGPPLRARFPHGLAGPAALTSDGVLLPSPDGDVFALRLPAPVPGDGERLVVWMELLPGHRLQGSDDLVPLTEAEKQQRLGRLRELGGPLPEGRP